MESTKTGLRGAMRARRAALDAATVTLAGRSLAARLATLPVYAHAGAILAYSSSGGEMPLDDVIADASRRGKRVYLPRCEEHWFSEYSAERGLERGPAGVLEPVAGEPWNGRVPGLVLVPLLAWSPRGERLGRGGGWYDRVLPRLRLPAVGIGFDLQERAQVPIDPWDVRLDFVVTESRVIDCGGVLSMQRLA